MIFRRLFASIAILTSLAGAVPAAAVVTTYYDEALFIAATSGLTSYTIPHGAGEFESIGNYAVIGPVLFVGELALGNDGVFGAGVPYLASRGDIAGLFIGTSIGFHFGTFETQGEVRIFLNDFDHVSVDVQPGNQISFIGFTGIPPLSPEAPISTFIFTAAGAEIDIIDFTTDAVLPTVPEPATWVLLIGGFGAVGAVMRRRRHLLA